MAISYVAIMISSASVFFFNFDISYVAIGYITPVLYGAFYLLTLLASWYRFIQHEDAKRVWI